MISHTTQASRLWSESVLPFDEFFVGGMQVGDCCLGNKLTGG